MNVPRSICLGFEQYSSSLAKIRTDLVHSTRNINDAKDPHTFHLKDVMLGLKKANGEDEDDGTWYLKFFKEDVYILGFGLDLSEQDIWWLLDYRIRQRKYEKTNLGIENKIVFFDSDSSSEELEEKYKPRNNLLRAFDVEIVYLSGDSFREKFQRAIGYIRKDLETKGIL